MTRQRGKARVTAGRALIRRYVLALTRQGTANEAAVTAASVPPLSGGTDIHCSAATHELDHNTSQHSGWLTSARFILYLMRAGWTAAEAEAVVMDVPRGPERIPNRSPPTPHPARRPGTGRTTNTRCRRCGATLSMNGRSTGSVVVIDVIRA
jgi:hypothetical protein